MPNVCIGILARNEAERIGALIADLSAQTLCSFGAHRCRLIVVANGCTDGTADAARAAFAGSDLAAMGVEMEVHELTRPGKSNAWNVLVHDIVPPDTDFVIFLDGDIRIPKSDTLGLVLNQLIGTPNAVVAIDESVKDLSLQRPASVTEWLIRAGTGTANETRTAIAGALYCVRYPALRPIWLPIGLPGEDGFLRAMLLTSSFTHAEALDRIVFTEQAYHVFESIRTFKGVVAHNVRLAIGTAINILLFGHLRKVRDEGEDLGDYIRERNLGNPDWINELVKERLKTNYFPLERRFVLRRLRRARRQSIRQLPRYLPVAMVGTLFDLVVFLKATGLMRRGAGAGYW